MLFFISFIAGVVLSHLFNYFPFTSSFILLLVLIVFVLKKKSVLIPVVVAGILYAFFRYAPAPDISDLRGKEMFISGTFVSGAIKTSYGRFIQDFHVDSATPEQTVQPDKIKGMDISIISDNEFETGSRYEITVKIGRDRTVFNPGLIRNDNIYADLISVRDFSYSRKSLWQKFQDVRTELNRYITTNFGIDSGGLVSAITTGQRTSMSEELRAAFNSTGLAHILSISGTHFGLFSVFLFGIFRLVIKYLPYRILQRLTVYLTPSQGAAVLCLPLMIAYLGLSGLSIPAVRAFIMIGLFLIGLLVGRKGFWLNSLLFAAFIIVLWNPDSLLNLSFQLSFIAVLFIGFSVGYMKEEKEGKALRIFKNTLFITLAASLGTAPLVAYHFHYFPIISPLSNLFVTPLIGFVLLPLALISSFVFVLTGHYAFETVVKTISDIVVYIVMNISEVPFVSAKIPASPVFAVIFFYAFYIFFNKRKAILISACALIMAALFLSAYFKKQEISITYLDVGQGDASVAELQDNKIMVIDTGRSGREVAGFLRYRGRETIDALVLSHSHPDHSGGADYLIKHFKVKEIWDNGRLVYPEDFSKGIRHIAFERGDIIEGEEYKIYIFHPYKEFYTMEGDDYAEENNSSLVFKIQGKQRAFLFAGDIEEEAEENIAYLQGWLDSDVIKVPHHGGKTSASRIFFDAVSPSIAVISAGRENPFGHPHQEMIENLGDSRIYRTDADGAVKITERGGQIEVKTYKDFQFTTAKNLETEIKNIKRLFAVW
ncbi:MAG: DNA internalization-related competence protein ComEC/Rec2 [Nitrospirae bacterium]|nr:DNA internalization-related competence protein ComEC/Rec2 [Nitrospirota bacterium]